MVEENQPYFPGRDYPDREIWLKKRCTNRREIRDRGAVLYSGKKPLVIGTNAAKRSLDGMGHGRGELIKERHAYYRGTSLTLSQAQE